MTYAIGFDVYGTLVDPAGMQRHLRPLIGDLTERFALLWREKLIEYAFRRGLMGKYENYTVCTRHALLYTLQFFKVELSSHEQESLIAEYQNLPVFVDVVNGLRRLKAQGHYLVASSNGPEFAIRNLLSRAGVLTHLECVVSVDDLRTYKPSPTVYVYLARSVNRPLSETWLVSSNAWDVIGAKAVGLKAAWLKRSSERVFDPWGIEPDLIVQDLVELAAHI
ncbi:hypothetical protein BH10CHL1_BH10CHL1_28950 [soil metagenome]